MTEENWFGTEMIWWKGVVEARKDPLFLGRCKVRIFGWHTQDKTQMPTENLPWALPSLPIDNGRSPVGLREGDWCWGFFMDGKEAQQPIMCGFTPGIPEEAANPETGYYDPTPEEELTTALQPRPPEFSPIVEATEGEEAAAQAEVKGRFDDPNKLPGANVVFGELQKDYNPANYKWDVNNDGVYNAVDALQIVDPDGDGVPGTGEGTEDVFSGEFAAVSYPMSRYPLEPYLNEPTTPRISRNEKIEETIVAKKKGLLDTAEAADHEAMGVGSDQPAEAEAFGEPETPYAAVYPFNHVYESESGHYTEIDDTPGAERLHWYHRSGTFKEIHPDGTQVEKVVKKGFHFVVEEHTFATKKFANFSAAQAFRINAGAEMNLKSGADQNRDVGGNANTLVKGDSNNKILKNHYTVIDGDVRILVKGSVYLAVEGDLKTKVKGDILMDAGGDICLTAAGGMHMTAPQIHMVTPVVEANVKFALSAASSPIGPPTPAVPLPCTAINDADNKDNFAEAPASPKEGFIWEEHTGDLWKPISDSDGNAVSLSLSIGQPHFLLEALPTGTLEDVTIKYKHKDGTITQWDVKRPVHTPGVRILETGVYKGNGNGGRDHYRWKKPGAEYPVQMYLRIGSYEQLILSADVRHEAF